MLAEIFLNYTWKAPRKKIILQWKNLLLLWNDWLDLDIFILSILESRFWLSMTIFKKFLLSRMIKSNFPKIPEITFHRSVVENLQSLIWFFCLVKKYERVEKRYTFGCFLSFLICKENSNQKFERLYKWTLICY